MLKKAPQERASDGSIGSRVRQFPWRVFLRFAGAWVMGAAAFAVVQSRPYAAFTGAPTPVVSFDPLRNFGLFLPLLLAAGLCAADRRNMRAHPPSAPSDEQLVAAVPAFFLLAAASFAAVRPSPGMEQFILRSAAGSDALLEIAVSAMYLLLFLPMAGALPLFFPWRFLVRMRGALVAAVLIQTAYACAYAAAFLYHAITIPSILAAAAALLSLLPGTVRALPAHWWLEYEGFRIVAGPACSGLPVLAVFAGIFLALYARHRPSGVGGHLRAAAAGLLPCLLLPAINALRIAAIMVIGAHAPRLAVSLFHEFIGTALFLALFLAYMRVIAPRVFGPARR